MHDIFGGTGDDHQNYRQKSSPATRTKDLDIIDIRLEGYHCRDHWQQKNVKIWQITHAS